MKKILSAAIILLVGFSLTPQLANAQIVDTLDIMKEFDEFSFRGANPVNPIKDSSKIREHYIGVKWGMGLNSVYFSQDIERESFVSGKNFGIFYTYYHTLWGSMPNFGIETGIQFSEIGFTAIKYLDPEGTPDRRSEKGKESFQSIMLPLVSQFKIDFWRMRLLMNLGCFASYKMSYKSGGVWREEIAKTYKKGGYGIIGGGGMAFLFHPFELHLEVNYRYNLSNVYDKEAFYDNVWVSSHSSQLLFSVGLFMRIGGSSYVNPANKPTKSSYKK